MSDIAVIFGGPSPEHDVSVLTGLQAAHELQRAGHSVQALYWTKTAEWFAVDAALEATAFIDGVPKGRSPCASCWGPAGDSKQPAGASRSRSRCFRGCRRVLPRWARRGWDVAGRTRRGGIAYTGPGVAAAALGMDKLAFGGVMVAAGLPTLPRVALTSSADDKEGDLGGWT